MGALVGLAAASVRVVLKGYSPELRYAVSLGCLATLALIPLVLFAGFAGLVPVQRSGLALPAAVLPATTLPTTSEVISNGEASGAIGDLQLNGPLPSHVGSTLPEQFLQLANAGIEYLPWVWLLGSPLTLLVLVTGVTGIERLRRQCDLLSNEDLPANFHRLAQGLGIARKVTVGVTERVAGPMLLGILRPLILLPPAILGEWSPEQVEMVLLHELAHVRRHDNLVNFLQRIIESLLFFHPVVWKVSRWVRLERELCCDAVVLRHTGTPRFYAETLASLALPGLTPRYALASLANHQLVDRIRHIMNLEDRSMKVSYRVTGLVAVLVVITSAAMVTWAQQPQAENKNTTTENQAVVRETQQENGVAAVLQAIDDLDRGGRVIAIGAPQQQLIIERVGPGGNQFEKRIVTVDVGNNVSKDPWSAQQATGAPDTGNAGDFPTAWAARDPDSADECLTVTFQEPVEAVAVLVYETFNPGAISQIRFYDRNSKELQVSNFNAAPVLGTAKRVLVLPISGLSEKVARVEMQVNSAAVPGWNEIDAVGLVDGAGTTRWATGAEASSSFSELIAQFQQAPQDRAFPSFFANTRAAPANNQGTGASDYPTGRDRALLEKLQAEVQLMKRQQQTRQTELQNQLERIDREIERAFEARESASKKYEEMIKTYGKQHPARMKTEAEKRKYTDLYEDLLRKKGYLRSIREAAPNLPSQHKPEPDRVERLEEEVRGLRKVLEELQEQLKKGQGKVDPATGGAIHPAGSGNVGQFIGSDVITLDPYANPPVPAGSANPVIPTSARVDPNTADPSGGTTRAPRDAATPEVKKPTSSTESSSGATGSTPNQVIQHYFGLFGVAF
jgi:beta-lactamase regulating signal transducer with metallopeptidase domain